MDILIHSQIVIDLAAEANLAMDSDSGLLTVIRMMHRGKYIPIYRWKNNNEKLKDVTLIVFNGSVYIRLIEPVIKKIHGKVKNRN